LTASILTIAGSAVNRPTAKILLNRWKLNLDGPDELEFSELAANLPGTFAPEQAVTLSIGGTTVFSGWIFWRGPSGFTRESGTIGYRALSLKFGAYLIPITASDGTGTMVFNLPSTNINYQPTEAGLSVGTILSQLFAQHSAQLGAIGVTTDSTTATQLSALTVVPPDPVYIQGNRLWSQVDQLMQLWYGSRYAVTITGTGLIRCIDTTTLTPQTLTFGTDPILLDAISEDTSECYTQVINRGRDNVEPAYLALSNATLVDPHAAAGDNLEASWTINNYLNSGTGTDHGTVTSMSSTTLTVQSSNGSLTWAANYWSGIQAQVSAINASSTGLAMTEYRRITANTALTAGGTSILTVDIPFSSSGYTTYKIFGTPPGVSQAYRRLNIANTYIAQHLVNQFNYAVKWAPFQGQVQQTWYPAGVIIGSSGGVPWSFPASFEIVPYDGTNNGYILFYQPWVTYFNSQAALLAGGSHVQQATDIQMVLPYSRGTMSVSYPSSGYAGTAFSRFNVQRTLIRDYETWWDQGSATAMTTLAQQIHATVSNVVQEGQITYIGQYLAALTPGSPIALNLANFTGTTSYEAMAAPVRTASLEWTQTGGSFWATRLGFTTKRQMYSGDRLYVHPSYAQGGALSGQASFRTSVNGMPSGNVLESAFMNANMDKSNLFSPVFNADEQRAMSRASGAEQAAQSQMAQSETDTRGADALRDMQGQERQAQDQVFGRGVDPTQ